MVDGEMAGVDSRDEGSILEGTICWAYSYDVDGRASVHTTR